MSRSDCPRRFCSHPRVLCGRAFGIYYSGAPHYRLAVRARAQAACAGCLFSSSRAPAIEVESDARRPVVVLLWSAQLRQNDAYISAASAPRRRVLQKPAPLKCRRRRLLAGPRRLVPHCLLTKLAAALVLARRLPRLRRGRRPAARAPQGARHPPRRRIGRSPRYPNTPASAPPRLREAAPSAAHPLWRGRRRAKAPGRAATRLNAQRSQPPPRRKHVARASFSKLGDARAHGAGRV